MAPARMHAYDASPTCLAGSVLLHSTLAECYSLESVLVKSTTLDPFGCVNGG